MAPVPAMDQFETLTQRLRSADPSERRQALLGLTELDDSHAFPRYAEPGI
jgi:hypothetical protein